MWRTCSEVGRARHGLRVGAAGRGGRRRAEQPQPEPWRAGAVARVLVPAAPAPREAGRQEDAGAGARVPGPAGRPGAGPAPPGSSEGRAAPVPPRLSRLAHCARSGGRFKRPERGRRGARGRGDPAGRRAARLAARDPPSRQGLRFRSGESGFDQRSSGGCFRPSKGRDPAGPECVLEEREGRLGRVDFRERSLSVNKHQDEDC